MTIGYRETFPRRHKNAGEEMSTDFETKILDGTKRHTLRNYTVDKETRWKNAEYIHHTVRNRTSQRRVFRVQKNPKNLQRVRLEMTDRGQIDIYVLEGASIWHKLSEEKRCAFIKNDGFDSEKEFTAWFEYDVKRGMNDCLLIHYYPNYRY